MDDTFASVCPSRRRHVPPNTADGKADLLVRAHDPQRFHRLRRDECCVNKMMETVQATLEAILQVHQERVCSVITANDRSYVYIDSKGQGRVEKMAEVATAEQIAEYETQLANIEELLAASPNDESLLALKNDLVELLHLTRNATADAVSASYPYEVDSGALELDLPPPPPPPSSLHSPLELTAEQAVAAGAAAAAFATEDDKPSSSTTTMPTEAGTEKKKVKMLKDFVVPPHLIVSENDSEADKKRKRRALKALKSQHRERRREVEHEQKQKSWQSFQKKKKVTTTTGASSSIFATQEAVNDRVGVISRKTKTEFGQRKRHKQI